MKGVLAMSGTVETEPTLRCHLITATDVKLLRVKFCMDAFID